MSTKAQAFIVHPLRGGLDTMSAPTILSPDALVTAENVDYFSPGSVRKRLGTTIALPADTSFYTGSSGMIPNFTALASFRPNPSVIDPTSGQYLLAMGGDSVWSLSGPITGQLNTDGFGSPLVQSHILIAGSKAIFSTELGTVIPKQWNGNTPSLFFTDLDDCAPRFGFAVAHLRRIFAAGVNTAPSTVYFSAAGNIEDWEGEDASSLTFDEGDGDRVVGISKTFRGGIYIFKGFERGSVHAVTGRTIRQFAREKILDTAPAVNHASIVTTPNDIYWLSQYGVHSLAATEKYGNTQEAFLSRPIHSLFSNLQTSHMSRVCWGVYHPLRNIVAWGVPEAGSGTPGLVIVYHYPTQRWSLWRFRSSLVPYGAAVLPDIRVTGSDAQRQRIYYGAAGRIWRGDEPALADYTSGYTTRIKFPNLIRLGDQMTEMQEKSFQSVTTFVSPTATSGSAQLNITIDGRQTTQSVSLQSTGGIWGTGTYGSAVFGGNSGLFFTETPIGDRGRSIQLEYVNSAANTDLQIYGYAIRAVPAEAIAMEAS